MAFDVHMNAIALDLEQLYSSTLIDPLLMDF